MSTSTPSWKPPAPDPFSEITTTDHPAPSSGRLPRNRAAHTPADRYQQSTQAAPAQTQAWANFLAEAVRNGLDPTLVTQWLTVLADATGSPVLPPWLPCHWPTTSTSASRPS
ncbi:hypothetical protein [Kitasatospora kifunensis]|uniref:Uncharacterized protein n=1 Tax=Kitasatospora kifunensis TaxID=58351 RepID=A0A7W7VXM8_KITKI|nr:hypothetical protein [Kitasatospora kifunensis]MBB4926113.1 hypothetical protein [Kitasatospora kifunensis]